jgi:aldose sugar dehydrogenase
MRVIFFLTLIIAMISSPLTANPGDILFEEDSHQASFRVIVVADTLAAPWGLDFLPNGRLIVTEWAGNVRLITDGVVSPPLAGAPPVLQRGDRMGGMLDIAVHPDFAENQLIYLCYLHGEYDSNVSRIARARLVDGALRSLEVIFEGNDRAQEYHHSGCRMIWGDDGRLFATFGDRRHLPDSAQDKSSTTGTIIRIEDDGGIPADNPFITEKTARPEIWAFGVRNVQGAVLHPETRALWFSEHGSYGGDEVNILKRGANYGWPIATYGIDYDMTIITEHQKLPGVEEPLIYWRPSTAPSGLAFYAGDDFPDWRGDLFMGSLADRRLIRMEIDGERVLFQEPLLAELDERIREVIMGPDGCLYIITDADPGMLLRIEPADK